MTKKYFTLDEANQLVPTLEIKLSRLLSIKRDMAELIDQLQKKGLDVETLFAKAETDDDLKRLKSSLEGLGHTFNASLFDIEQGGCLIKDLDLGLIDFYAVHENSEIFLCWQLGEKEVRYWHGTNEGFSARKNLYADDKTEKEDKIYH